MYTTRLELQPNHATYDEPRIGFYTKLIIKNFYSNATELNKILYKNVVITTTTSTADYDDQPWPWLMMLSHSYLNKGGVVVYSL